MQHLVLFINALIIPAIVAALVITAVLKKEKALGPFYRDMELFLLSLLVTSVAYLPMYYDYALFDLHLSNLTYSICWDLLWMGYICFWMRLVANSLRGKVGSVLLKAVSAYAVSYFTGWLISFIFIPENYYDIINVFEYIKIALLLICLAFSLLSLRSSAGYEKIYCVLGSAALLFETAFGRFYFGENKFLENFHIWPWLALTLLSICIVVYASKKAVIPGQNEGVVFKSEEAALAELGEEYRLTDREIEIFKMILRGKSNKEIGKELFIGDATVKTHIHNLLKKLSASNRVDAILLVKEKMQSPR